MRTALATVEEIFQLRWSVLRPGLPRATAIYPMDALGDTFHIAGYDSDDRVVGCVTFFPDPWEAAPDATAYRFSGMATAADVRGRGYGAAVLAAGIAEATRRGADIVWCNGRSPARGFYERAGFTAVGDEFTVPISGPHFRFVLPVDSACGRQDPG